MNIKYEIILLFNIKYKIYYKFIFKNILLFIKILNKNGKI